MLAAKNSRKRMPARSPAATTSSGRADERRGTTRSQVSSRHAPGVDNPEKMICEHHDFSRFGRIIEKHIAMRMRVFVRADRSREQITTRLSLRRLRCHVSERPVFYIERLANKVFANIRQRERSSLTHGNLNGFHGLEDSSTKS